MGNRRYSEVSVCDMADCRERRVMRQNELIKTLGLPVVSFTMNIAGPVKNSRLFEFGFAIGLESIAEELGEHAARTEISEQIRAVKLLLPQQSKRMSSKSA